VIPARISLLSGRLRKSFLKHVAARLLPSFGDSLGARVTLLEVVRSMRKRIFSFSFQFFFRFLGSSPRVGKGLGWKRGSYAFAFQIISQMILVQVKMIFCHWFHLSRFTADSYDVIFQQITCSRCFGKKGPQMTRLGTRTKESNICASILVLRKLKTCLIQTR